jgi:hypothetical protein
MEIRKKLRELDSLMLELQRSLEAETKKVHLFNCPATLRLNTPRYYIYDLSTKKQLVYGTASRIKSYLNLRNITNKDIFNDSNITL